MSDTVMDQSTTTSENPNPDTATVGTVDSPTAGVIPTTVLEKKLEDFISDETKADPGWKKFEGKSYDEVFKSYKQLESTMGSRIKLPDETSTMEDKKAFWEKLGKPTISTDYAVHLDPSFGVDEAGLQAFQKAFYDNNFTKEQAAGILQVLNSGAQVNNQSRDAVTTKERIETETSLRSEWGANFDMNKALAKRAIDTVFGEDNTENIVSKMGNHKGFIHGMHKVGSMLSEKGLLGKSGPRELGGYAPAEAQQLWKDIIWNPDNAENKPYHDSKHPQHSEVNDKVQGLIRAGLQK